MNLQQKELFLLDMDGTLYLGNRLFDGTAEFLDYLHRSGKQFRYLTNNSSRSVRHYAEKMNALGIRACEEEFFTSTDATVLTLKKHAYRRIYAFGTASFRAQLREAGLPVTDRLEDGIDCLCMGFDTELTFSKLEDACILLGRGVEFIATNPDWVCPTEYGYVPDCGSVSEMLFRATGRRPVFIGKPEPAMALLAMEQAGVSPERTVLLGDRVYTDIACGVNAGIDTAFLLSGEGVEEDCERFGVTPTAIFENIRTFYEALCRADGAEPKGV